MVQALADELIRVVDEAATELRTLGETVTAAKPNPEVWSAKEIVGHLIDSAANNHQRFIRAQQANGLAFPGYEQDAWVRSQDIRVAPGWNSSSSGHFTITIWHTPFGAYRTGHCTCRAELGQTIPSHWAF